MTTNPPQPAHTCPECQQPVRGRMAVFTDESMFVEGCGFRIAVAEEGVAGYRPTGVMPGEPGYSAGSVRPWFWGPTIEAARKTCDQYNARTGLTPDEAFKIVWSTMPHAQWAKAGRRAGR